MYQVEFSLPDLEGRTNIFKIHARSMSVEKVRLTDTNPHDKISSISLQKISVVDLQTCILRLVSTAAPVPVKVKVFAH